MLLSYMLFAFALTSSITAWRLNLLGHMDQRLTEGNRYWHRLKVVPVDKNGVQKKGDIFSWSRDLKYDDVIQFHPAEATPGASTPSFFELQRVVQLPDKYCLHVPHGNPYKELQSRQSLSSIHLGLEGFWGRLKILSDTVSNFRKA